MNKSTDVEHAAEDDKSELNNLVIPDGYLLIPIKPTFELLKALAIKRWPADWEEGKKLQMEEGCKLVPPNAEMESAVGRYNRLIRALRGDVPTWRT